MKKMVFSYFNKYEQETGAETQQNQYESMGEQALLNEMETHFGEDKNTYGKLKRTTGYTNFFTSVMNKLMKDDPYYPKNGSFTEKVGHYQSTYMDIHQEGNTNFQKPADKMLGPKTRDYMKGWLQAIVDQSNKAAPVMPSIPQPIYNTDTSGVSNLRVDSLPRGDIKIDALKGVGLEGLLDQLGINRDLFTRGKQQGYITADGQFNLVRSNPYTQSADRKNITVNFAEGKKITLPLSSIVNKGGTGKVTMDQRFLFDSDNFTRAVFAEFPKKITEATDKTIEASKVTFNTAYKGCMNILEGDKGRQDKMDAISATIKVLEPIQWKVYDITKKEGPNVYYDGTLAAKTASEMYNQIQGLRNQFEAHSAGKAFFDTWYSDVSTFVLDEDGEPTKERTTVFDNLNTLAGELPTSDPRKGELDELDGEINHLNDIYAKISPKYEAYKKALSNANPQETIDEQFNPARFVDILNNARSIHTQGLQTYTAGAQSLTATQ